MILCLETATPICSVALVDSNGVVSARDSGESKSHASSLTVLIESIFAENNIRVRDLEAIAVSRGPGSYTGLRIGVSAAKGIAFGASLPLIAVDTTLSMFYGMAEKMKTGGLKEKMIFCPMLDARRMEVYYALYDSCGKPLGDISAAIITKESFSEIDESAVMVFFGDGASKCRETISRKNSIFDDEFVVSASFMHKPVYEAMKSKRFEDVAYFEPFYLKDFIATIPKKNILG